MISMDSMSIFVGFLEVFSTRLTSDGVSGSSGCCICIVCFQRIPILQEFTG